MIGTVLHERWRILAELGRGGMGEVYLAEHLKLGRQEAVKILLASVAKDPQFIGRFRREARAVNRLRHPNIIALHDFGELPDGRFFLSMEYATGESLHKLLRQTPLLPVPRALHLLGQLAYGVHHAHSRGVVHRDLKPGNLIVTDDEMLKVLDFGMAKIVASDHSDSVALSTGDLIWGTAKYMAPERMSGVGNDPRTDLYAIGCIAFEMIAGAAPFTGSPNEVIHGHLKQPPPRPSDVSPQPGIPPELDAVILRLLAKKPDDRFATAADLFAALNKVPGYPTPKAPDRRRFVPTASTPLSVAVVPRAPTDTEEFGSPRGTLRRVAEALLDLGLDDTGLVSGIACLADHERSLARLEAAQDSLEHEAAAVRETVGDRESSLRFALAEIQFAASRADQSADAGKIRELETRLTAAISDGDLLRALEQGIASMAALRANGLAKLKAAYDALERDVDAVLPAFADRPTVAPFVERLALVRARRPAR